MTQTDVIFLYSIKKIWLAEAVQGRQNEFNYLKLIKPSNILLSAIACSILVSIEK